MEGPSLVILQEELAKFRGQKVMEVSGNTKQPKAQLKGRMLDKIDIWGKVLFLRFTAKNKKPILTRTHFLMFGSYTIDTPKADRDPRLKLRFKNGTLFFYTCSFKFVEEEDFRALDPRVSVLSPKWDEKHVLGLLKKKKTALLCDLFLDQTLFAGSGNIVKNEVLFNLRRHPLTTLSQVPEADWPKVVHSIREYCENFYEWKKKFELRRHWQVYRQRKCPLCEKSLVKENLGKMSRKTFYCDTHQRYRDRPGKLVVHAVLPMKNPNGPKEKKLDH